MGFLGCRNCSRRRINCDLTQPRCRKCARDNLECYGLSGTYRWVGASGVRKTGRNNRQVPANGFDVPAGDIQLSATVSASVTLGVYQLIGSWPGPQPPPSRRCGPDGIVGRCFDKGRPQSSGPVGHELLYVRQRSVTNDS
jgi:hypothetical protein